MSLVSATHLVLIPSYNAGPKLFETVRDARRAWTPVWVVVDGSTDKAWPSSGAWPRRIPD